MPKENDYDGSVSEWNEGMLFNLRLHQAQEMINDGKVNPFSATYDKTNWKFQVWKSGIDILFGEGDSKYKQKEIDEVIKVKKFIETLINVRPPFKKVMSYSIDGKNEKFISLPDNQCIIKEALEIYERMVKKFNDVHGLSTRNMDEDDWRGL